MYIPGLGSLSVIIHLLAKYPAGALGVGILTMSGYLASPLGPTVSIGGDQILKKAETVIVSKQPELQAEADATIAAFKEVESTKLSATAFNYVCERIVECKGLSKEKIEAHPTLAKDIGRLYFFELSRANGVEKAKVLYKNQ